MKVITSLLILASAFLSLKHGWDAIRPIHAEQARAMANLGITQSAMPYFGVFSMLLGCMLFFPQTFWISNVLNAFAIVLIMALSLHAGQYKMAWIEIPFLAMPLILIALKYPFSFKS